MHVNGPFFCFFMRNISSISLVVIVEYSSFLCIDLIYFSYSMWLFCRRAAKAITFVIFCKNHQPHLQT